MSPEMVEENLVLDLNFGDGVSPLKKDLYVGVKLLR